VVVSSWAEWTEGCWRSAAEIVSVFTGLLDLVGLVRGPLVLWSVVPACGSKAKFSPLKDSVFLFVKLFTSMLLVFPDDELA
jgi:hypothetical protein